MQPDRNDRMIATQLVARGIRDERVLEAFRSVPRQLFVPASLEAQAYDDSPLPIGCGQTISQPYIVALMTSLLELQGSESVLEVGTGSGYQTAILARLAGLVYSAEIKAGLSSAVQRHLEELGIRNAVLAEGDARTVHRSRAPFDRILSAAAPEEVPSDLLDQLAEGGRAILPVGLDDQHLWRFERRGGKISRTRLDSVRFVPML
jgi:protein-L-isoaspartate(D-aspartate) O-methyltransferase